MAVPVTLYSFKPLDQSQHHDRTNGNTTRKSPSVTSFTDVGQPDTFTMPVNDRRTTQSTSKSRAHWDNQAEYYMAVIGFVIGLHHIWTLPYLCIKNGGAAFLVPYVVMVMFVALPLMYMELILGQLHRLGCVSVWDRLCPMFKGIGLGMCLIQAFVSLYQNTHLDWALLLLSKFCLGAGHGYWLRCDNFWNTPLCREPQIVMTQSNMSTPITSTPSSDPFLYPMEEYFNNGVLDLSSDISEMGKVIWTSVVCLFVIFLFIYFIVFLGVRSLGKVALFTTPFPFLCLSALCIRAVMLEGSVEGLKHYLNPQWSRLEDPMVWYDAINYVFFSMGPGLGVLISLSSYNKRRTKSCRDALFICGVSILTSLSAVVMVMALLSHVAFLFKSPLDDVVKQGQDLVFIILPEALGRIQIPVLWLVLFFLVILTTGLGRSFCGIFILVTSLGDEWPKINKCEPLIALFVLGGLYLASLPTAMRGGIYVIALLDMYASTYGVYLIAFFEITVVSWIYGVKRFAGDIEDTYMYRPNFFWQACWAFICPLSVLALLVLSVVNYSPDDSTLTNYVFPLWATIVGWVIAALPVLCIPVYAIYRAITNKCKGTCLDESPIDRNRHHTGDVIRVTTSF